MAASTPHTPIIAVNAGSSSLKVASFDGEHGTLLSRRNEPGTATGWLTDWVCEQVGASGECRIGHRIVASRPCPAVEPVTATLLQALQCAVLDDPIHLPIQIALIDAVTAALPLARQFACSDSAFHGTIPAAGRRFPLPRKYDALGIERIGFHGLSCASVVAQLRRTHPDRSTWRRLVIAHLGSGASVTAVYDGESRDTSMGFSPDGGVVMASRPGDLDPGVIVAILRREQISADQLAAILTGESGLKGRAGDTGDLRRLLEREATDPLAAEAIEMACRSIARSVAGAATTIGGIDMLAFTGGVGEHLGAIRARICDALSFLGVEIAAEANAANGTEISAARSAVRVVVIGADEESMIASLVQEATAPSS